MFTLQRKIVFLAVIPILVILFTAIGTIEVVGRKLAYEMFERTASAQFFTLAGLIDRFFHEQINALQLVSNSDAIRSGEKERQLEFLMGQYPFFKDLDVEGLYLFEKSGESHGLFGEEFNVADRAYFRRLLEGRVVISAVLKSRATKKPIVLFLVPIFGQSNQVLGGIASAITIENVAKLLVDAMPAEASFVALHDMEAQEVLVASRRQEKDTLAFHPIASYQEKTGLVDLIRLMQPGARGMTDLHYRGEEYVSYFGNLPNLSWSLAVNYPKSWVVYPISQIRNYSLFALLASLALGVLLVVILRRLFVAPVHQIMAGFAELGRGNLEVTVPINERTDEIALLAQAFNATVRDFRRSLEERLAAIKDKEKVVEIIDATPDFIVITDTQGKVRYFNQATKNTFKYTDQDVGRLSIADCFTAASRNLIEQTAVPQALRTGVWEGEVEARAKDERIIKLSLVIIHHKSESDDRESYFSSIARDISALKDAENEAVTAREKLEAAMRLHNTFLMTVSHELMTPLTTLAGTLEILEVEAGDAVEGISLSVAKNAALRLNNLLSLIIRFMEVVSGKSVITMTNFRLDEMIDSIADNFSAQLRHKRLVLQKRVSPHVHLRVRGDREKISEILTVLVDNAIKFTQEGEVCVAIEKIQQKGYTQILKFSVIDNGVGIAKDNLEKIFTPFYQADATITREYYGLGIGLAYCRELVNVLNGQIGVKSEFGKGSCFWVMLALEGVAEPY